MATSACSASISWVPAHRRSVSVLALSLMALACTTAFIAVGHMPTSLIHKHATAGDVFARRLSDSKESESTEKDSKESESTEKDPEEEEGEEKEDKDEKNKKKTTVELIANDFTPKGKDTENQLEVKKGDLVWHYSNLDKKNGWTWVSLAKKKDGKKEEGGDSGWVPDYMFSKDEDAKDAAMALLDDKETAPEPEEKVPEPKKAPEPAEKASEGKDEGSEGKDEESEEKDEESEEKAEEKEKKEEE